MTKISLRFRAKILVAMVTNLLLVSCEHGESSKKYNYFDLNVVGCTDVFIYNNIRFIGVNKGINDKTTYSYFCADSFIINNDCLNSNHCQVEYSFNSSNFYYINCFLTTYSATAFSVDTGMFCLRFDELDDASDFPTDVTININIDNPLIRIVDPVFLNNICIWAPLLHSKPAIDRFHYKVDIKMWDEYSSEQKDYVSLTQKPNTNVPAYFESYRKGNHFIIEKTFDDIGAFFNHIPSDEIVCPNDAFLIS